ncbi:MAG: DUF1700 domain-containing protein [Butyrivibrio sp.]
MNSYLETLERIIRKELPKEEYSDVMQYYTEYFADAGPDKEQEVINELGTPETLAGKIISEYRGKQPEPVKTRKGLPTGWVIFIAVVGSPLWLALLCVAFALLMVVFALIAAFGASGISITIAGAALILCGIATLFSEFSLGLYVIGLGFVMGGIGFLLIMLTSFMIQSIIKLFKKIFGKSKKNKQEVV